MITHSFGFYLPTVDVTLFPPFPPAIPPFSLFVPSFRLKQVLVWSPTPLSGVSAFSPLSPPTFNNSWWSSVECVPSSMKVNGGFIFYVITQLGSSLCFLWLLLSPFDWGYCTRQVLALAPVFDWSDGVKSPFSVKENAIIRNYPSETRPPLSSPFLRNPSPF